MPKPRPNVELVVLLLEDQRRCWTSGGKQLVETYIAKHPELTQNEEGVLDLIYAEYCLREENGDAFNSEEYQRRFPQYFDRLKPLFELHRAVASAAKADSLSTNRLSPSDVQLAGEQATESRPAYGSGTTPGLLKVRCPNCRAPIEVAVDTALTDLTCASCGSHFSLVDQDMATRIAPSISKLGRFELIERLGIGGFGSVWKARDKELDRTVAIKIPRRALDGDEQEKFFREARAAAQLRHPGIVSVFEVGRDGDNLYIVSDFVRGATLGDWLTGQKLSNREAAELCAKIADALHHAHEQGVVHRDLKPANIMMDFDGQPHLMDFGLARRESGELTVTVDGQVLGTPAYMSPEQAQGEAHQADRRSDVYSLGVILFELLTGELPFRGNVRMLIKQVINDEAPSPRKLDSSVSKDMETIALKCMQKDPSRRYATAADLADDLRRYLHGEPILARPISTLERGWRWYQRNRAIASLGAAAIGLLGAVAMVASVGFATTNAALKEKQEAATTAEQVSKFTTDLFRSPDPIGWAGGENFEFISGHPSDDLTVGSVIDRGSDRIKTELEGQPEVQARLLEILGGVYRELGQFSKSAQMFKDAIHAREGMTPVEPLKIAAAEHSLGNTLYMDGDFKEAEEHQRVALKVRRQWLEDRHLDISNTLQSLGLVLGTEGKFDEAFQAVDEAIAIRREKLGNSSQGVAIALSTKAAICLMQRDTDLASQCVAEAMVIFDQQNANSRAAEVIMKYQSSELASRDQNFLEADRLAKETLELSYRILGKGHPYVAFITSEKAATEFALGKCEDARRNSEQARSIWKKTVSSKHPWLQVEGRRLAIIYAKLGRFDDALKLLDEVTSRSIELHGRESYEHANCFRDRSVVLREAGRTQEATEAARTAYAIGASAAAHSPPQSVNRRIVSHERADLWPYRAELAQCALATENPEKVFSLLKGTDRQTSDAVDSSLEDTDRLRALELLGRAYIMTNKSSEAELAYKQGEELATQEPRPREAWGGHFQTMRARLLVTRGDRAEAEKLLKSANQTLRRICGTEHPWTIEAVSALKTVQQNRVEEKQTAQKSDNTAPTN